MDRIGNSPCPLCKQCRHPISIKLLKGTYGTVDENQNPMKKWRGRGPLFGCKGGRLPGGTKIGPLRFHVNSIKHVDETL